MFCVFKIISLLTILDGVGQDPTGQSLHCSTGTNAAHLQGFLAGNLHTKGTIELAYWGMRMHNEAFCFCHTSHERSCSITDGLGAREYLHHHADTDH